MSKLTPGSGYRLRLLKRPGNLKNNKRYYVYYITIPSKLVEVLGLKVGDEFKLQLEVDSEKTRMILDLVK